jgi:hypothetical protein
MRHVHDPQIHLHRQPLGCSVAFVATVRDQDRRRIGAGVPRSPPLFTTLDEWRRKAARRIHPLDPAPRATP